MILEIPKQAVVNRIIPKDRFNFDDATKIGRIRWLGKLGPTTINLPAKKIQEIEIFSIEMFDFDDKRDLLQFYIDLNSGGVVHSKEEIERVKSILEYLE